MYKEAIMKDKVKKILTRILAVVLVSLLLFGIVASSVITAFAAPEDDETIINGLDTHYNHGKTDCLLRFFAVCPEDFPSSALVVIQNDKTGQKYQLYLAPQRDYQDVMYVPAGQYTVLEMSIPTSTKFTFVVDTTSITATKNGDISIVYTMKDIDKIIKTETGQFDYIKDDQEGNQGGGNQLEGLYDTPYDYIKMSKDQKLYYSVSYSGNSDVAMRVWGFSKQSYEGVVKIVKSGILGEAEYQISLDGGKTYFQNVFTANSEIEISSIGLSFGFVAPNDTDELIEGDTYSFKTLRTFSTNANVEPDKAMLMTVGSPTRSVNYIVTVMSSGVAGVFKIGIKVNEEGAKETVCVIPEDGVLKLQDNVQLVFNPAYEYKKGQTFDISISLGEAAPQNYTPLIILGGIVGFGTIVGLVILSAKKDKKTNYIIREYRGYQDESEYDKK
jgi:hypothetical protein